MEWETIVQLISSLGFPIVCCLFMWRFISTTLKDFSELIREELRSTEKMYMNIDNTLNDFQKIITENTRMLEKLCDRIERKDNNA